MGRSSRPSAEAMPPNNSEQADALRGGRIPKNCHPLHVRCALPHLKFFFQKRFPSERLPPFRGQKPFLGRFSGEGALLKSGNEKSPLPGVASAARTSQARLRCAEPCQFRCRAT